MTRGTRESRGDEFIRKAIAKHGEGTYLYDKVKYDTAKKPVLIGCPKCSIYFPQTPDIHISGCGCPDCGLEKIREATRRKSKKAADEFKEKAIAKHGEGTYLYDKVDYVAAKKPVLIWCPKCSIYFPQTPSNHLNGRGCPTCFNKIRRGQSSKKKAAEEFIEKAIAKHGEGTYLYDKVKYDTTTKPVLIGCPKCENYFPQTPNNHLNGRGCPDCGFEKIREVNRRKSKKAADEFKEKAIAKHGEGKFLYDKVEYDTARKLVLIGCPKCSIYFPQTPSNHLDGNGCPTCYNKTEKKVHDELIKHYLGLTWGFKANWCKNPETNRYYPFDFCIKEKRLIIELDGKQHFEDFKYFKSSFIDRHAVDLVKQVAANESGFRVIRLMQEDVWSDKYDWLTELLKNIEDDTKQNIFMCKNGEYDFFSESMEMITTSNPYQPYSTSSP